MEENKEVIEENKDKEIIRDRKEVLRKFSARFFSKENYPLLFVLGLAIIIQVYFLLKTFNQPLWWDEAVYLLKSKAIAFGTPDVGVNRGRALFNSFLWAGLFKIGLTEHAFRIIQTILSVVSVGLVYKIMHSITKNKFVAFFSGFSLAVCWVVAYATTRFFPDTTGLFLWLLMIFLFWKGYAEESRVIPKYFYWIGPVFVAASYAREMNLMFVGIIFIYMFAKEKFSLFKKKEVYILIGITLLAAVPFFLYYYNMFGNPIENWTYRFSALEFNTPEAAADEGVPWGTSTYFRYMPDYFGWIIIILLLTGLIYLSKVVLGLDLIFKNKKTDMDHLFLLLLWIIIPFAYIAFQIKLYDERYILIIYPAVYAVAGYALYNIKEYASKKISKILAWLLIIVVLFFIFYPHFQRADSLIEQKLTSYAQVKDAGLWIEDNSNAGDIIFAQSQPQLVYYAEKSVFPLSPYQNETDFIKNITSSRPKYLVLSIFENHPPWAYSFPQNNPNLVTPVQAYMINDQQPALVIYQFNYTGTDF
ncbi:glycosyltransferase family 39 protein [Candidatus Pacearchaeota archaeon]|nr:glycosyltransferase family 39 protein [Candidatus Pacearchaeota archaeon]